MDREELILRIKEAGQSLINNAESVVGTEKFRQRLTITIDVDGIDRVPVITVNRDFIPEYYLDRISEPA